MAERGRWPGADVVGGALDEAEHVGGAGFRGEVVHFVVHEEAESGEEDAGAVEVVEGGGAGDGVAILRRRWRSGWCSGGRELGLAVGGGGKEVGGANEGGGGGREGGVDGAAPGGGVFFRGHGVEGERGEVGVAEVVGTVFVGAAEGLGDEVDLGEGAVGGVAGGVGVVGGDIAGGSFGSLSLARMLRISRRTMPPEEGGGAERIW